MITRPADLFLHIKRTPQGILVDGEAAGIRGHQIHNPDRKGLDGIFVQWHWDGHTLEVRNDRYGFQPTFYFANQHEVAISDSLHRLLAAGAPRELDDAALAAFLRLGHYLGDDTPFRAIRMLGPNAHLQWRAGELQVTSQIAIVPREEMSRPKAMDRYVDLFRAAIARRGAPWRPLIVPLSGGRDSRHIVFELCRQGLSPDECITARYLPSITYKTEVEAAAEVCDAVGVSHRVVGPSLPQAAVERRKNRMTSLLTLEHGWYIPVSDYLNEHAAVTYDGMAGDVLTAGHFLTQRRYNLFTQGRFDELFLDMQGGSDKDGFRNMLSRDLSRRLRRDLALERFHTECRRHVAAPNPIGSLSIFNRTRRVASLCAYMMQSRVPLAFSPFLDHDLFDFLSSLPAHMYVTHMFHTDMIRYAYPQYANIPFASTRPGTDYHGRYQRFARDVARDLFPGGATRLMCSTYVLPRLLRSAVDPRYSPAAQWLGGLAIYLAQLAETGDVTIR